MRKLNSLLVILPVACCLFACNDNGEGIGNPIEISKDYDLPQSGASDEANQRILEYYDKYDSYVLYDFTNKDAMWVMTTGNASSGGREYYATVGDPANVDAMLDYIEDIWLNYFPDDFLKNGGMPYRVFLADEVYMWRDWGDGTGMKTSMNYMINGNAIIIGGMNQIPTMDEATKKTRKLELFNAMWDYYKGNGLLSEPQEFYEGTDYVTPPHMSYVLSDYGYYTWAYTDEDLEALRNRGFVPKYSAYYSAYNEIYMKYSDTYDTWSSSSVETIKSNDYTYYMSQILNATDEEAAELLKYPAIATKWNCLVDYYKESVGVDLESIGK